MNIRDLKEGTYITALNMFSDRDSKYLVVTKIEYTFKEIT